MGTIGYNPSGAATDFFRADLGNPYNYRAYVPDPATETGWATSMRFGRIGKLSGSNADFTGVVLVADPNPSDIIETTAGQTTNVLMTYGGDGGAITANLLNTFKIRPGDLFGLGVISIAGVGMGMQGTQFFNNPHNFTFYSRDDSALPPADPMNYSYSSNNDDGWMAIALNYDKNLPPATPIGRLTSGISGFTPTVPTLTPTFEWDFSDPNETLSNGLAADYIASVEYRVTRVSDGHQMYYYSQSATSAERSARHVTETYDGPALSIGVPYTWDARHDDRMGLFSPWSNVITFTCGAGAVSVSGSGLGTPKGKQDTLTPGPFVAQWQHSGGLHTVDAQLWILDSTQKPIVGMQTGDRAKAVAPGSNISFTYAELTFANMKLDSDYFWIIRGKASDGNYSAWSTPVGVSIDKAPSIPNQLTDNISSNVRPLLTCKVVDLDDTVSTGLFVKLEIIDSGNTVHGPYSMALRAFTSDTWDLQTTSTHLPSLGDYTWRAYAGDGFALSGKKTGSESNAIRSAPASIHYAAAPSVAITFPTNGSTIDTSTPVLAWTAATQAAFRVIVYDLTAAGDPQILDTHSIVSTITGYTIPDGLLTASPNDYRFHVEVTDASDLTGTDQVDITLAYTQPDAPAGWLLSPVALDGDDGAAGEASAVLGSFTRSTDPEFDHYLFTRQPSAGQPNDPQQPDDMQEVKFYREYDITATTFIDYTPASNMSYLYRGFVFTKTSDGKLHSSVFTSGQIQVTFSNTIIFDTTDPLGTRVVLPYRSGRTMPRNEDKTLLAPWGGSAKNPTILRGATWNVAPTDIYPINTGSMDGDNALVNALDGMSQSENALCFRTGYGFRAFGSMLSPTESQPTAGHVRTYGFTFQPTNAREGV